MKIYGKNEPSTQKTPLSDCCSHLTPNLHVTATARLPQDTKRPHQLGTFKNIKNKTKCIV